MTDSPHRAYASGRTARTPRHHSYKPLWPFMARGPAIPLAAIEWAIACRTVDGPDPLVHLQTVCIALSIQSH